MFSPIGGAEPGLIFRRLLAPDLTLAAELLLQNACLGDSPLYPEELAFYLKNGAIWGVCHPDELCGVVCYASSQSSFFAEKTAVLYLREMGRFQKSPFLFLGGGGGASFLGQLAAFSRRRASLFLGTEGCGLAVPLTQPALLDALLADGFCAVALRPLANLRPCFLLSDRLKKPESKKTLLPRQDFFSVSKALEEGFFITGTLAGDFLLSR